MKRLKELLLLVFCLFPFCSKGQISTLYKTQPSDFVLHSGQKIKLYQNRSIQQVHPEVERVIIVVHGVARNADEYFDYVVRATEMEKAEETTLVLAPHFKIDSDPREANELFWTESWKFGDRSETSGDVSGVSSYQVLDEILEYLWISGRFPAVKKMIVAGHSAGGQLVTRYAAGSPFPDRYPTNLSYVVANPSSYLYFSPKRWKNEKGFSLPDNSCPEYNSYPYGVNQPNNYMSHVSSFELTNRFNYRHVTLLLGEADTLPEYLDTSCEANLQGKNRLERGLTYFKFIKTFFPKSRLKLKMVPGVGHSGEEMFQSKEGRELLFH